MEEDEDEELFEVQVLLEHEVQSDEEVMSSAKVLEIARGKRKVLGRSQGTAKRQRVDPMTSESSSENGKPETPSISQDIPANFGVSDTSFLELQEVNNISKAAYKELMIMALQEKTWILATPALGSLEEFLQIFRSPPTPGMIVERSIECAIVPINLENLVSYMVTAEWGMLLSNIVHRSSGCDPTYFSRQLCSTDYRIKCICLVTADFQLPTPYVKTRKFNFLRCLRQILPDIWAIVDVSIDYMRPDSASEQNCRRRPSGMIVRRHDNVSKVIWIENVEVHDYKLEDNIYSEMIKSNFPFSAKCWLSTLKWGLKRKHSIFVNVKMTLNQEAHAGLLDLATLMKLVYKDIVDETPSTRKWIIISNEDVRILRYLRRDQPGSKYYVGVTTFRVQAKPLSVFGFLIKKNIELHWPSFLNAEGGGPEELVKLASDDDSNSITLHRNTVSRNELGGDEAHEYLLQEASMDGFCSFVISTPLSQFGVNAAFFFGRWSDPFLMPSGFAILPDGSDSNSSVVTIVRQQEPPSMETDKAIEFVSDMIHLIIDEIQEEVEDES